MEGLTAKQAAKLQLVENYVREHGVSEGKAAAAVGIPPSSWHKIKARRGALGVVSPDTGVKTRRRRRAKVETVEIAPLPNTPPYLQSRVVAFVGDPSAIAGMFHL